MTAVISLLLALAAEPTVLTLGPPTPAYCGDATDGNQIHCRAMAVDAGGTARLDVAHVYLGGEVDGASLTVQGVTYPLDSAYLWRDDATHWALTGESALVQVTLELVQRWVCLGGRYCGARLEWVATGGTVVLP